MKIKFDMERVSTIRREEYIPGPVAYWMSRDQRINDNWALIYAILNAQKYNQPIVVFFNVVDNYLDAGSKIFSFMMKGIKDLSDRFRELNIPFFILKGEPKFSITDFINQYNIQFLVTDFDPLRIKRHWQIDVKMKNRIPFKRVDTHNIVPFNVTSDKQEYAAHTIRKKINRKLRDFLKNFPPVKKCEMFDKKMLSDAKLNNLSFFENFTFTDDYDFKSGERYAFKVFQNFINEKFLLYHQLKNDPTFSIASDLSPYLHFGQISSQRIVLELNKLYPAINDAEGVDSEYQKSKKAFLEELIIRKELSDNFCYYNTDYDNFNCFPDWAKTSLNEHRQDIREHLYTLDDFENADTHDIYWNAAQIQMMTTGKMHGYMRMYWAKKILEWTESPEYAMEVAITLNDKYELDGRDPNGYTGIAWSIGGVHDKPYRDRYIFGKVRYMNATGLKRKFKIDKYADKYLNYRYGNLF